MAGKAEGYLKLRRIKKGRRICERGIGKKRCGVVTVLPTKSNGWFRIRWDGDRKSSAAHANWFYTVSELRKLGLFR